MTLKLVSHVPRQRFHVVCRFRLSRANTQMVITRSTRTTADLDQVQLESSHTPDVGRFGLSRSFSCSFSFEVHAPSSVVIIPAVYIFRSFRLSIRAFPQL